MWLAIGPEVALSACLDQRVQSWCEPIVVGSFPFVQHKLMKMQSATKARSIESPRQEVHTASEILCWDPVKLDLQSVMPGKIAELSGRAAYEYLVVAAQSVMAGEADAITTAPLQKEALHLAGINFPGHTEILADVCGVNDFGMMLYLPHQPPVRAKHGIGVVHVTLHTSIASVPNLLSTTQVAEKILLIADFMRTVGCNEPRIGVCALNPHGGENGLFGNEEAEIISPGVAQAQQKGINASRSFACRHVNSPRCGWRI